MVQLVFPDRLPTVPTLSFCCEGKLCLLSSLPPAFQVTEGEPSVMWLSGLHIPESYLTALVQATCRRNGWPLDRSTLFTQVTKFQDAEEVNERAGQGTVSVLGSLPALSRPRFRGTSVAWAETGQAVFESEAAVNTGYVCTVSVLTSLRVDACVTLPVPTLRPGGDVRRDRNHTHPVCLGQVGSWVTIWWFKEPDHQRAFLETLRGQGHGSQRAGRTKFDP